VRAAVAGLNRRAGCRWLRTVNCGDKTEDPVDKTDFLLLAQSPWSVTWPEKHWRRWHSSVVSVGSVKITHSNQGIHTLCGWVLIAKYARWNNARFPRMSNTESACGCRRAQKNPAEVVTWTSGAPYALVTILMSRQEQKYSPSCRSLGGPNSSSSSDLSACGCNL